MTEEEVKLRMITPAIALKWDKEAQVRMEYSFTGGRQRARKRDIAVQEKESRLRALIQAGYSACHRGNKRRCARRRRRTSTGL
jgi:hypothetical protein